VRAGQTKSPTETLIGLFQRAGYLRSEPAILQPAATFLDLSGEDIRRRMFMTQDAGGNDLCIRPEYTIPVAMAFLNESKAAGLQTSLKPAAFCYAGPVFRMRVGEIGEFVQGGIESFGRIDREAADAEVLALTIEAVQALGLDKPAIRMGDAALLSAVLDRLKLTGTSRRRLLRAAVQGQGPAAVNVLDEAPQSPTSDHAGLLAALEGQDSKAAKAFVEDILSIAGISTVGGRSARDIAERFLARAAERENGISPEVRDIVARILAVSGDPDDAALSLRTLSEEADLGLGSALDSFEARTGFMAARGVDVAGIGFSAAFARNLDYYTGFVFELTDPASEKPLILAGGGRYDALLARLGAAQAIPAVGASIWVDRITAGGHLS
jgi:ATP phosphoribosyltransferase regulatory subunit